MGGDGIPRDFIGGPSAPRAYHGIPSVFGGDCLEFPMGPIRGPMGEPMGSHGALVCDHGARRSPMGSHVTLAKKTKLFFIDYLIN